MKYIELTKGYKTQYSKFLITIADQTLPSTKLGRGMHYSIVSDTRAEKSPRIIAILWDEDHDERVIGRALKLLKTPWGNQIKLIGERKGGLAVYAPNVPSINLKAFEKYGQKVVDFLPDGDCWNFVVNNNLDELLREFINDSDEIGIKIYLENILKEIESVSKQNQFSEGIL